MVDADHQRPRVLLTLLGLGHQPSEYRSGTTSAKSPFASIALVKLLPDGERPSRIIVLVTKEARDAHLDPFQAALEEAGLPKAEPKDLTDPQDVDRSMDEIVGAVPARCRLRLDLTHAFRHLVLLLQPAAHVLVDTRDVWIDGVHYGLQNGEMLELTPLYVLPAWYAGVRELQRTGSVAALIELIEDKEVARILTNLDLAWRAGLPLEVGRWADGVKLIRRPFGRALAVPYLAGLRDQILADLAPIAAGGAAGESWKSKVKFDSDEERRQLELVVRWRARGLPAQAVGLAREWLVSKAVAPGEAWLDKDARRRAEGRMNSLPHRVSLGTVTDPKAAELASLWVDLRDKLRNYVQHAGMRPGDQLDELRQSNVLDRLGAWLGQTLPFGDPGSGTCLVTPVGMNPGNVFTAVVKLRELGIELRSVLVVGSADTLPLIDGALRAAGFEGQRQDWAIPDPYTGYPWIVSQQRQLLQRGGPEDLVERRRFLADHREVLVNLAGGTTLLGIAAEALRELAGTLGLATRRLAVSDRRAPAEQKAAPFVVGELCWVDA